MNEFTQCEIESYREDGFLLVKNLLVSEECENVLAIVTKIFNKYAKMTGENSLILKKEIKGWLDPNLNEKILRLRNHYPEHFALMYDSVRLSARLLELFNRKKIIGRVAQLLTEDPELLFMHSPTLRMDCPFDKRNILDWHQEMGHYVQSPLGDDGVTCWTPMHRVDQTNGTLKIRKGSHKEGLFDRTKIKGESALSSATYKICDKDVQRFEEADVIAEAGDVLFFNNALVHKSGTNTSKQFRFVSGARYHKLLSEHFRPGFLTYQLSKASITSN